MTAGETRKWLLEALQSADSTEPEAEARWMLRSVAGGFPFAGPLSEAARGTLLDYIRQREAGRPLQYVLGGWDFMGLSVKLREGALIPRPETETLVELALKLAKAKGLKTALDLGTGSGCIAIALAALGDFECVTAVDYSADALVLARENAALNGVSPELLLGSWFAPVHKRRFSLIVSNPPYIESSAIDTLSREVRYEPRLALDGGTDGLDAYRAIAAQLGDHLMPGGVAIFEAGYSQARAVCALFEAKGFKTKIHRDLAGIDRIVEAAHK